MIHNFKEVLMGDHLTNWIAGFAVVSWWWLPYLQDYSQVAALLLPFAGLAWFAIQGWAKIYRGK